MSESILSELFRLSLNVYEVKVLKKKLGDYSTKKTFIFNAYILGNVSITVIEKFL